MGSPQRDIFFDPLLRANTPDLRQAVIALADLLESLEKALGLRLRSRKAVDRPKFRTAVEALACNLLRLQVVAPGSSLAVPRGHDVMWPSSRYAERLYGQHFLDALDAMAHPGVGVIAQVEGGRWRSRAGPAQRPTFRPTKRLDDFLSFTTGDWRDFRRVPPHEVLLLRGSKDAETGQAKQIEYADTAETRRRRLEIEGMNGHLLQAPIILPDGLLGFTKDGHPVDPNRRAVRRIFNNDRWDHGGRLYGGFWETMGRDDRRQFIRIGTKAHPGGEEIRNVDFEQLFPRLCYWLAGSPVPDGDLYDIPGCPGDRDGWKRLMNALLFGRVANWPRDSRGLFPPGTRLRDAVEALKAKHAAIAPLLEKEEPIGHRLMFIESQILITAVLTLFRLGVTALPLHDSVLVGASEAETAKAIMQEANERHTGESRAAVSIA